MDELRNEDEVAEDDEPLIITKKVGEGEIQEKSQISNNPIITKLYIEGGESFA